MLAPGKVEEVRRLLALGNVSQRQISRQLRVARGMVSSIASENGPTILSEHLRSRSYYCRLCGVQGVGEWCIHRAEHAGCENSGPASLR